MRYAQIESGVVINIILADAEFAASVAAVAAPNGTGIGWRYIGGEFLPPLPAPAPATTVAAIKAKRDQLSEHGGYSVVVSGVQKWFHSDAKSKTQQIGLVMMGAAVPPVQWKTLDGTTATMSQAMAAQIFQAGAAQDMAIFAAAEAHLVAMATSPDPASYDFSEGWPATFPGAGL